jgi:hypothetical protein
MDYGEKCVGKTNVAKNKCGEKQMWRKTNVADAPWCVPTTPNTHFDIPYPF